MGKIIGIYKIVNPEGSVYIGQSKDIEARWVDHKKSSKKRDKTRLYESFFKYGYINHAFEIVEECQEIELDDRERYWQEFYEVIDRDKGLNSEYSPTSTKERVLIDETRLKKSKVMKDLYTNGFVHGMLGKNHTEESKERMRHSKKEQYDSQTLDAILNRAGISIIMSKSTGIFYYGIKDAAQAYNMKVQTLADYLIGKRKKR